MTNGQQLKEVRTEEVGEELKPTFTLKAFARSVNFIVSFYALKEQDTREKDQGLPKVVNLLGDTPIMLGS